MKQIIVRPAAAADIEEAYEWYERQRPGLGEEFLADRLGGSNAVYATAAIQFGSALDDADHLDPATGARHSLSVTVEAVRRRQD